MDRIVEHRIRFRKQNFCFSFRNFNIILFLERFLWVHFQKLWLHVLVGVVNYIKEVKINYWSHAFLINRVTLFNCFLLRYFNNGCELCKFKTTYRCSACYSFKGAGSISSNLCQISRDSKWLYHVYITITNCLLKP